LVGAPPVLLERFALPGKDRRGVSRNRRGGVVLRGEDVARAPSDDGAEFHQSFDEDRSLDGHVQRTGDVRAFERLARAKLGDAGHETGHFNLGEFDFHASEIGLGHVANLCVFCGEKRCIRAVSARVRQTYFLGQNTHKYVHTNFHWSNQKGLAPKSLKVFLKKDKKKGKKKGPTTLVVTLRRRFVVDDPSTTAHLESRGRFARTNPFPTRKSRGDGSNAFARVSSGAIKLRAILRGCGVDDAFSHQSNRFQERRASLRAQLLGRHK
tara:strand:- start:415 stop:1215 length:801 start_codon:yes stop_codon:yes gene_type:complete